MKNSLWKVMFLGFKSKYKQGYTRDRLTEWVTKLKTHQTWINLSYFFLSIHKVSCINFILNYIRKTKKNMWVNEWLSLWVCEWLMDKQVHREASLLKSLNTQFVLSLFLCKNERQTCISYIDITFISSIDIIKLYKIYF